MRSKEVDGGHENEPREHSTGEHDGSDTDSDDVADAKILRSAVGANGGTFEEVLGADVEVAVWSGWPKGEEIIVLEEGVQAAEAEAEKDSRCEAPPAFAGDEDVGARRSLGVNEGIVLFDDELAAQGDHEEDTEPAAEQRQRKDARGLQIESEEDESGKGEDDAGGDGLACIAGTLDDVVFEDAGFAEGSQDGDRKYRDWDGRGDRKACTKTDVDSNGSEENTEEAAQDEGTGGELWPSLGGWNERFERRSSRG